MHRKQESGAALFVGLIILLLITLMLVTAFNLASSNVRSVGNMQFRDEALAASSVAVDRLMDSSFTDDPKPQQVSVDIDGDGTNDYTVQLDTPVCVMAVRASDPRKSSLSLPVLEDEGDWSTTWQIDATVTPHSSNKSGAALRVREGIRVLLDHNSKIVRCGTESL